jgi:hypothetical protein
LLIKEHGFKLVDGYKVLVLSIYGIYYEYTGSIYLGPPNIIIYNIGKNFISKEFKQYAIILGTATRSVPVEAYNSVGMVERYYGPLRRIYHIITAELPDIVFGAYPRMVESDAPNPIVV